MTVVLQGSGLTVADVVRVAREGAPVELSAESLERMRETRALVERVVSRGDEVYGVTTGVGARKKIRVPLEEIPAFNRRLIENHRVGTGPDAPPEVVRATMVRHANALAKGTSGVRPEIAKRIVRALNDGERPRVRMLGSLGQGDLAPMADLAAELFGDIELLAKEGIALVNSNAFSTALASLAVADTERLVDTLDVTGAMDLEAFAANLTMLHPAIGDVRPYPGLCFALERLRSLLEGSYLWEPGAARNLQDPLTFRCLPQIHGATRDALDFAKRQLEIELNASQENPLVIPSEDRIISVANFDILPLAAALDFLRIALAPALTSACERLLKLLQGPLTGLPDGLAPRQGLAENSLGEFGVAAQALTAEARLLAQPVSFEVITSTHAEGIEDRITMAPLAARRLSEMVDLGERLVAIGFAIAAQALELRDPPALGAGTRRAYDLVRGRIPFMGEGDPLPSDLGPVRELIVAGSFVA
ncbi:MAG TPA: aromatic amino acid ammonia-lyase [Gaiellaceae bacterium]|jgi:histidine ammonia-lyase|nr:aromatic amino acid ammonia-lyase [Gaiellaceae bacterium]